MCDGRWGDAGTKARALNGPAERSMAASGLVNRLAVERLGACTARCPFESPPKSPGRWPRSCLRPDFAVAQITGPTDDPGEGSICVIVALQNQTVAGRRTRQPEERRNHVFSISDSAGPAVAWEHLREWMFNHVQSETRLQRWIAKNQGDHESKESINTRPPTPEILLHLLNGQFRS